MRKHGSCLLTVFIVVFFAVGVSLILYPLVSDRLHVFRQEREISSYTEDIAKMDSRLREEALEAARAYNARLAAAGNHWVLSPEELAEYEGLLSESENGLMGYIEIPVIEVRLPIYHGTGDEVLSMGVGHLEGSSLPVGGESTHTVISGHRGLPSAKLFTNLDRLREGDIFTIHVLNESLVYQVDQILVVEPEKVSALEITEGEDHCTLMTCTPYGINTHRLLVRGSRIENEKISVIPASDVPENHGEMWLIILLVLLLLCALLAAAVRKKKKRKGT